MLQAQAAEDISLTAYMYVTDAITKACISVNGHTADSCSSSDQSKPDLL